MTACRRRGAPSVESVAGRSRVRRLKAAVKGRRRGLVVIYGNPDPDALGSAWALQRVLHRLGLRATIAYTGEVGRPENEAMVEYLRIPAGRFDPASAARADFVAVVDAQPSFFPVGQLPRCDAVFDHHPVAGPAAGAFTDIRPSCLAASSILTEYVNAAGCRVDWRLATALFYGIVTDARHSDRGRTRTDSWALGFLEDRIDRRMLRRIECAAYSLSGLDHFATAITRLRHNRGALYVHVGPVPTADICAQIADFLVRVKEANWALVSGVCGNLLIVVFRSDGQHGDAGRAAAVAFGRYGSAGGHETAGRADIPSDALPDGVLVTQSERIERFVLERLSKARAVFKPILHELMRNG